MPVLNDFDLDHNGKIDLSAIYDQPDPRSYFQTLHRLDYRIPEVASPVFGRVVTAMRAVRGEPVMTILDVGSSYGVNAAILKHGYGLSELFGLYGRAASAGLDRGQLVVRDRRQFLGDGDIDLEVIGLDTANAAIGYAREANIIDAGIVANFEERTPTSQEARRIGGVDLVISTGAIGYVGRSTFTRILDCAGQAPWLALFALRMFSVRDIADALKARGYRFFKLHGQTFRQRQFAGADERQEVLARLAEIGVDTTGRESTGWYHAEFFLAAPAAEVDRPPLSGLVDA